MNIKLSVFRTVSRPKTGSRNHIPNVKQSFSLFVAITMLIKSMVYSITWQ